ncbi:MAG: hypothetical protein QOH15_916 [Gaiellales bacterium]|jgi:hypothetical protein|nr:hypothetical protein [Gaiellales bacterium]
MTAGSPWPAAGRRLARLLLASVAGTAIVAAAIGLLAGSSLSRSLSVGFYLVGCGTLVLGFALAVRGPVRLGRGEQRGFRAVTREERDDAIADSALLVVLAVALLALGVLADTRYPLV